VSERSNKPSVDHIYVGKREKRLFKRIRGGMSGKRGRRVGRG